MADFRLKYSPAFSGSPAHAPLVRLSFSGARANDPALRGIMWVSQLRHLCIFERSRSHDRHMHGPPSAGEASVIMA